MWRMFYSLSNSCYETSIKEKLLTMIIIFVGFFDNLIYGYDESSKLRGKYNYKYNAFKFT